MCIYSNFTHAELLESALHESLAPQTILLRFLFLSLDGEDGIDDEDISPYRERCGPGLSGKHLCRQSVICHNVVDDQGRETAEKTECPDCTGWAAAWRGKSLAEIEAAERIREATLDDDMVGDARTPRIPVDASQSRGTKRNRSASVHVLDGPKEQSGNGELGLRSSTTVSSLPAQPRLLDDIEKSGTGRDSLRPKRAKVVGRGSYYEPTLAELDARHGIINEKEGPQLGRSSKKEAQGRSVPHGMPDFGPSGNSTILDASTQHSITAKSEPTARGARAQALSPDRIRPGYKGSEQVLDNRAPPPATQRNVNLEQSLQRNHESLLAAVNAHTTLPEEPGRDQQEDSIDEELAHAIQDDSFKRATQAYFNSGSSNDAKSSTGVINSSRQSLTRKVPTMAVEHDANDGTGSPPPAQQQTSASSGSSILPSEPQRQRSAPPTPPPTQPQLDSPSTVVAPSSQEDQQTTIRRLRARLFAETDKNAALARQLAEVQAELAEERR